MKIKLTVSKNYNHFFFVQTLADWHFSCRSEYIEKWLDETGPLSGHEKEILANLKIILEKYGFEPIGGSKSANIFDYFMRFDRFGTEEAILPSEISIYQDAMAALAPRFEKVWSSQGGNLNSVKNELQAWFEKSSGEMTDGLKTIFGSRFDQDREFEVILLISTEIGGGGANNGPGIITLECGVATTQDANYLLATIWHEITHLALSDFIDETADLLDEIEIVKAAADKATAEDFDYSAELIIFSLFSPMSALTDRYFPTEISTALREAVARQDVKWLLNERHIFPMYLLYLNGSFFVEAIKAGKALSPKLVAEEIVRNHQIVRDFYAQHDIKVIWFKY